MSETTIAVAETSAAAIDSKATLTGSATSAAGFLWASIGWSGLVLELRYSVW